MTNYWRQAGLTYIRYSQVCARVVRHVLKADFRVEAVKRDESFIKPTKWENGKPIKIDSRTSQQQV